VIGTERVHSRLDFGTGLILPAGTLAFEIVQALAGVCEGMGPSPDAVFQELGPGQSESVPRALPLRPELPGPAGFLFPRQSPPLACNEGRR
jgi:hypothetical protein